MLLQWRFFSAHPQKRVWGRRYVIQILNGFPGREKLCKYLKKLAIICTNSLDFGNILNAIHEPDVNVQTKYILPVRQLLHNVYYYINLLAAAAVV
jgi:hypothetical protein